MWIWKWILTQFLYSFPFEITIKFWDYIFSTDIFGNIAISLALLHYYEKTMLAMDFSEISMFLRDLKDKGQNLFDRSSDCYLDLNQIFKLARTFALKSDYINQCAKQYASRNQQMANIYVNYYAAYLQHRKLSEDQYRDQIRLRSYHNLASNADG